jgi:AcrR family transcriptional regulator
MQPASASGPRTLADRAVGRRLAPAQELAETDVRALMDAGLALLRTAAPGRSPRVADIVAAAGLSNDAFYRYFASKDDLVAAIVEDGSRRLVTYVRHQMDKGDDAAARLRLGIEAIMKQATDRDVAASTRAVIGSSTRPVAGIRHGWAQLVDWVADAFTEPSAQLGSKAPHRDARAIAVMALGTMQYLLWQESVPHPGELEHLVEFACAGIARHS